jgi:hypothetical protein
MKLVLLDVNGVLGYKEKGKFVFYSGVQDFLKQLKEKYIVGIFSSTTDKNVSKILFRLTKNWKEEFHPIMDRSMTCFDNEGESYETIKLLIQFWENPVHNAERKWCCSNTLLLDDSRKKVRLNDTRNVLIVEHYDYNELIQEIEEKFNEMY